MSPGTIIPGARTCLGACGSTRRLAPPGLGLIRRDLENARALLRNGGPVPGREVINRPKIPPLQVRAVERHGGPLGVPRAAPARPG